MGRFILEECEGHWSIWREDNGGQYTVFIASFASKEAAERVVNLLNGESLENEKCRG